MKKILYIAFLSVAAVLQGCFGSNSNEIDTSADAYVKAVAQNDYQQAHVILDKLQANYLQYWNGYYGEKEADKFWNAANYIYKAEMQYLLPQNDPEAERRLLYTIDDFTPIGEAHDADYVYGLREHNDKYESFEGYITYASGYNKLCIEMIRVALRNGKVDFAKEVLFSMKDNYHQNKGKGDTYTYIYSLNNSAKEEAQKLIDDYNKTHK